MTQKILSKSSTRRSKELFYLDLAKTFAEQSTCLRRYYGAVIVKNDTVVGSGYNGAPRCRKNCCDIGFCKREANNIPSGERYELCRSVHAEQNAIISASKENMVGATLYLTGIDSKTGEYVKGLSADCCSMCKRMIINSGIEKVIIRLNETEFKTVLVNEWIEQDDTV